MFISKCFQGFPAPVRTLITSSQQRSLAFYTLSLWHSVCNWRKHHIISKRECVCARMWTSLCDFSSHFICSAPNTLSWPLKMFLSIPKDLGHTHQALCLDLQEPPAHTHTPSSKHTHCEVGCLYPTLCLSAVCRPGWQTQCLYSQSSTSSRQLRFRASDFDRKSLFTEKCKGIWPKGPESALCFPSINGEKWWREGRAGDRELFLFSSPLRSYISEVEHLFFRSLEGEDLT